MNLEQQTKHFEEFTQKMKAMIIRKGNDYANNADRLANFKKSASVIGISPLIQCLSLISTKVARLGELLSSGKEPQNEAVEDSILDLANYSFLLDCLVEDEQNNPI